MADQVKDAIGIGSLNVDLIYKLKKLDTLQNLRRITPGSEGTASLDEFSLLERALAEHGLLLQKSGGGSAANAMYALSKMGFSTGFAGKVGSDAEGDFLLHELEPVETSRIRRNKRSGVCLSLLDASGDRALLVAPNCNNEFSLADIDLKYLKKSKFLHLTSFRADPPFEAQKEVVNKVFPTVKVSFNPGEIYARRGLEALKPLIEKSYIMFLSDAEAEILSGQGWSRLARELLEYGPQIVVCTRGENGSHIFSGATEVFVSPHKVDVVDTTGAGDVYVAGFLAGLILGLPLEQCGRIASRAAAESITRLGRTGYPDHRLLDAMLNEVG